MEVNQINWEYAIYDIKDKILKHLSLKELCHMATMNTSWLDAVVREKAKRCFIQYLRLPYTYESGDLPKGDSADKEDLIEDPNAPKHPALASMLHVNPCTSLLIDNYATLDDPINNEIELLKFFQKKLPRRHTTIVLVVKICLSTENVTLQDAKDQDSSKLELNNELRILGMFFPNVESRARVHVASIPECDKFGKVTDRLIEDLGLNRCEYPTSTLLVFFVADEELYVNDIIKKLINKSLKKGKRITWTSVFVERLMASLDQYESFNRDNIRNQIVVMRISGPSVKSWGTHISYYAGRDEIERKLLELKGQVVPGRYCTGLLSTIEPGGPKSSEFPHSCDSSHDFMRLLKRVFPTIPFVGLFHDDYVSDFRPDEETIKKDFQNGFLTLFTFIIIISYD